MKKINSGLMPTDFFDAEGYFKILNIKENQKQSERTGKKYKDYTLELECVEEDKKGKKFNIYFLFERDFTDLIESFGEDETTWKGNFIKIKAYQDGNFNRWLLIPTVEEVKI